MTRTNHNPEMATASQKWTAAQNAEMVDLLFRAHDVRVANGGKLPHGWASENGRYTLAMVNRLGPDRTSYRNVTDKKSGKVSKVARSDWYNFKIGNLNSILTALGRPEFRWAGIPDYDHTQQENSDPMLDALLWRAVETAIARADARRAVAVG